MSAQTQDPEQDEPVNDRVTQLVGYLDGELDGTQMDLIEQELINDPDMRSHADILSRTWALLDVLEEDVSASRQFTKDTLATVSTEAIAERSASVRQRVRSILAACARYKVLTFFAAGVLGAATGLWVANRLTTKAEQRPDAVADAIVLENLDMLLHDELYREVPDVNALRTVQFEAVPTTEEGQ